MRKAYLCKTNNDLKMLRKTLKMTMLFLLMSVPFWNCTHQRSPFTPISAPHHFNELNVIGELLESQPELALDSIAAFKEKHNNQQLTALDANELLLREVQAQYKTRQLSKQSPDLMPVIVFYDSLASLFPNDADLQFLRASAHYYKGVEYAYAEDDVAAFRCYLQALDVLQAQKDWGETPHAKRFVALTYTRLSEVLYRYGLNEEAMESCRNATTFYDDDRDLVAMMRYEAAIYQAGKAYDKALARFEEAEALVPVGEEVAQLAIGARLYELQQYDSAYPHLKRAFAKGDHFARVDAAAKLAEICRDKGLADEELRYTRYYVENSMLESRLASKKMEIEYLYDDFNSPKAAVTTTKKGSNILIIILLILFFAIIGFLAFIIVRNRTRISHIETQISDMKEKYRKENEDKDLEISQMVQQLNDTRERLENVTNRTFEEAWEGLNDSDIVLKIKGMMENNDIMIKNVGMFPKLKLKEMDFIELVRAVNDNFRDCSQRFLKAYPDLNAADFRQCCLAILGMNDAQIAVLQGISYSGVNRRTKKILTAMQTESTLEQAIVLYLKNNW